MGCYWRELLAVVVGLQLSGCAGLDDWEKRYGPDPSIPTRQVEASVTHQTDILLALTQLSRCRDGSVNDYCNYEITVAGFNFVDEQCDAYLRELFIIDKERDRAKTFIAGADKLTNAILAVGPASKATMAIVAQAFGLTSSYLDVATDSYLYKTNSGGILHVVSELQAAYRNKTYINRDKLVSIPDVYAQIRGYLKLCMPPTIESEIENVIAKTTAVVAKPETEGPGSMQKQSLEGAPSAENGG